MLLRWRTPSSRRTPGSSQYSEKSESGNVEADLIHVDRQREASVTFSYSASSLLPRGPGKRLLPDLRPTAPPGDGIQSICTSVRRDEPLETEAVRKGRRYARGEVAVDRIEALIADAASCALIYRSNNLPWD